MLSSWMWTLRSTMLWDLWTQAPQIPRSPCSLVELQVSQEHICFSSVILTAHLSNHVMHSSSSQIFSSQMALQPGRPTWAAWGTWPSITAKWASAKLSWSVEQSALEPVQQHKTSRHHCPQYSTDQTLKPSVCVKHNRWEKYCHCCFHLLSDICPCFCLLSFHVHCFTWYVSSLENDQIAQVKNNIQKRNHHLKRMWADFRFSTILTNLQFPEI